MSLGLVIGTLWAQLHLNVDEDPPLERDSDMDWVRI
jgi:hypothetical protein